MSGDISGTSDVRIEGELNGSVSISGVVVVAESGKVRTSIRGARVTVSGKVDGDILGEQLIELETTAVVNGDLLAPKILIKEGATLQGRVEMASPPPANSSRGTKSGNKGKGKTGNQQGRNAPSEKPSTESGSNQPMDKQSQ